MPPVGREPNDQAQRRRGHGSERAHENHAAPGVGCSAWFGVAPLRAHPRATCHVGRGAARPREFNSLAARHRGDQRRACTRRAGARGSRTTKLSGTGGSVGAELARTSPPPVSAAAPGSARPRRTPTRGRPATRGSRKCPRPPRLAPASRPATANPAGARARCPLVGREPNDQAQQPAGLRSLSSYKNQDAPPVGCSAWFGAPCCWTTCDRPASGGSRKCPRPPRPAPAPGTPPPTPRALVPGAPWSGESRTAKLSGRRGELGCQL